MIKSKHIEYETFKQKDKLFKFDKKTGNYKKTTYVNLKIRFINRIKHLLGFKFHIHRWVQFNYKFDNSYRICSRCNEMNRYSMFNYYYSSGNFEGWTFDISDWFKPKVRKYLREHPEQITAIYEED